MLCHAKRTLRKAVKEKIMKSLILLFSLIGAGVSYCSFAADDNPMPLSFQKNIYTYIVNKDGSYKETSETSTLILNDQGISDYGERKIQFTPKLESLRIIEAYNIMPDGRRISVPKNNIRSAKGDMDSSTSSYSDTEYKIIIYPKVTVGSQLYLKFTRVRHVPIFPGHFALEKTISPHYKYSHFEINLYFDQRINIKVDSKDFEGGQLADKDGMHRYQFTAKQEKTFPLELNEVLEVDYAPYVRASSFTSYAELGNAYYEKAKIKAKVTPSIQKLADQLTAGIDDKSQQTRKIYNWVSRNIRYVASYIGNGGYVPHDAQSILKNRWGDCKDHVVILEALLSAKGIESSPALINTGYSYILPSLPMVGSFNHVITYVPSEDLFLDSTSPFVRFGSLPYSDLGKNVVLVKLNRITKTPPLLSINNVSETSIRLKILPGGEIQGESSTQATGIDEANLRYGVFNSQSLPKFQVVNYKLAEENLTGTGDIQSGDPLDLERTFWIKTIFTLDPISNIPGPAAISIPAGLAYKAIKNGYLRKPTDKLNLPEICDSFETKNSYEIEFPSNIKITHIPDNVTYEDEYTKYSSTYIRNGNKIEVKRLLVVQNKSMSCGAHENELDKKFFPIFQRDVRAQIIYE